MRAAEEQAAADLSQVHAEELQASCIEPEHVAARGYRTLFGTEEDRLELKNLRIPRFMWRDDTAFPGLLIPEYRVTGELIGYQYKPAAAQRGPDRKFVKYASQSGTSNHLDVPPLVADRVRDPSNPLWITEGIKKADSLASRGRAVVTLTGVFNWRSKMGTLGDWEDIPLQGRSVVICFDADARDKRTVLLAMRRLGSWLESKKAKDVRYLIVPPEVNGTQVKGVDDFFCAGGTLTDLRDHAVRELPSDGAQDAAFSDAVLTDTVCSEELEGQFKWSAGLGWMTWTGKYWCKASDATVTEAVRLWALGQFEQTIDKQKNDPNRDMRSQMEGWRSALSKGKLTALVTLSRGILECSPDDFDSDPDLFNCPNGILDLRTGALVPHDPDRLMTRIAGVDYVKGAEHPDWATALQALPEDVRDWFQLRIGQAVTGHLTPDDVAVICQGGGENGKSTVFNALITAIGKYHIMVADRAMLGNASDNHPTELMDFKGARFAMLEETPESRRLDTNRLKKLVGTREITARKVRQDDVTFETTHSLFVNTNFRPTVDETDHGTWRRLALLRFPYTYRKSAALLKGPDDRLGDPSLRQRVETPPVMEAALAWAVEGAQRWYEMDRIMPELPERVSADTLEWRKESDPILRFIDDHLAFDRGSHIHVVDLMEVFTKFMDDRKSRQWSDKTFGSRFGGHDLCAQNGVEKKKIRRTEGRSTLRSGTMAGATYNAWMGVRFQDPNGSDDLETPETGGFGPEDPFGKPQMKGGDQDHVPGVPGAEVNAKIPYAWKLNRRTGNTENSNELVTNVKEIGSPKMSDSSNPPETVSFDLETASAEQIFTYGDGFVRLPGYALGSGDPVTGCDPRELAALLETHPSTGHNILGFDGLALAHHYGMDWEKFCEGAQDTEIKARLADPPMSKETGRSEDRYDLDHTAEKLGVAGKTDSAKRLKVKYGGYDKIPTDDPDYHAYLAGDVVAGREVAAHLPMTDYGRREHLLASLAGRMTLNGFAVDVPLLRERLKEGRDRKKAAMEELHDATGLPLGREVTRGRGKVKAAVFEPFSAPFNTTEGIAWVGRLWERFGVVKPPLTDKGALSTAAEPLRAIAGSPRCPEELKKILELMAVITTTRTVYQTAATYLTPEGRVHPYVSMRQASGRWSVTNPGLTVFGKRNGKHIERDIFVADPGHVIITCDLSQVDMRAVAGHCQDPAYMALFEPGKDVHQEIADQLGIARHDAKQFGHGYNYGLQLKSAIEKGMDPELAKIFYEGMATQFPVKNEWTRKIVVKGQEGELLDNGFGRKMRCDPRHAFTVAPALMGQGGARDITCEVLIRLIRRHPEYRSYLRAYVHDEFVFCVPEDQAEQIGQEIQDAFTWVWRDVPILCDLSPVGPSWGSVSAK